MSAEWWWLIIGSGVAAIVVMLAAWTIWSAREFLPKHFWTVALAAAVFGVAFGLAQHLSRAPSKLEQCQAYAAIMWCSTSTDRTLYFPNSKPSPNNCPRIWKGVMLGSYDPSVVVNLLSKGLESAENRAYREESERQKRQGMGLAVVPPGADAPLPEDAQLKPPDFEKLGEATLRARAEAFRPYGEALGACMAGHRGGDGKYYSIPLDVDLGSQYRNPVQLDILR